MNSKLSRVIDGVFVFLLVMCPLHCLVSSFTLEVNVAVVALFTAMFVFVFGLLTVIKEKKFDYAISLGIITIVYILMVILFKGVLLAELDYTVNTMADMYSQYINGVSYADFSSRIVHSATLLFVMVSVVLSGFFTVFIMRMRFLFPAVVISIVAVIPCFILVNTLPKLFPLLVLFATLFTLFVTAQLHRINSVHSGAIGLAVAVLMTVLVTGVLHFVPLEGYERNEWQDKMLEFVKEAAGLDEGDDGEIIDSIEKEIDLTDEGLKKRRNKKVMTVTTTNKGVLYLKGMAYANYNNNTWSILDESIKATYPMLYNSFTMTEQVNVAGSASMLEISTVDTQNILYTPYYLDSMNVYGTNWCDTYVGNTSNSNKYTVYYSPFVVDDPLNYADDSLLKVYGRKPSIYDYALKENDNNANYRSFIYSYYLELPSDVKEEMQDIIIKEGFDKLAGRERIAAVQSYIRNSAVYSLDTPKVPKNKDIALWFLKESDTGYCVHFATSATVMLRAMGIPARYVTGYAKNVAEGAITPITTDNAHAWVEYFDSDIGWVPLEVTPADFTLQSPVETESSTSEKATKPTEKQTEATKPNATTPETEEATEPEKKETDSSLNVNVVLILASIGAVLLVTAIALPVRRLIVIKVRERKFITGTNNSRARCAYRYLLKIEKYAKVIISSEVETIAQKARFGNGTISDEELQTILQTAQSKKELLSADDSKAKKIYYKFILALA